jgi:MFS family permease
MTLDRGPAVPLWLLGVLTFSGPVGMHIFVPALPAAAKDLHATPAALELTISLYILGLAVGQLIYGPVSDRFGRRPALLASPYSRLRASPRSSLRMSTRSSSRVFSRL